MSSLSDKKAIWKFEQRLQLIPSGNSPAEYDKVLSNVLNEYFHGDVNTLTEGEFIRIAKHVPY